MRTQAALLDQSFYNYPGRARRYHIANGFAPMCNRSSALINETTLQDATRVPVALRCQRRGCASMWPKEAP